MTDVEQPNPIVSRPSFASDTAYELGEYNEITNINNDVDFSVNSGEQINDTNEAFNVSVNIEAEITYNYIQTGVIEKIDRDISSLRKHNFENINGICKQINEDLFIFMYVTHNIFIPHTSKVND